jgi:mRNA interferase RelE/StbE
VSLRNYRLISEGELLVVLDDPRRMGSIKMQGEDAYRVRVGDYRIIYTIQDEKLIVLVVDVGHRRDVYRRQ